MGHGGTAILASVAAIVAIVSAYIYQKRKKEIIPWTWEEVGTLKKLHMYPLKSGHRVELQRAECSEIGLVQCKEDKNAYRLKDRTYFRGLIVYSEQNGEFRSARTYPQMVLIDVSVHDEDHIAIDAPTMRTLYVKIPSKNDTKVSKITMHKGEVIPTIDCGNEAASWLSRYILGKDIGLRLGCYDGNRRRDISTVHKSMIEYYKNLSNKSTGYYADLSSAHLISQPSVNDLNKRIGNSCVTSENFRPNFIVDGPSIEPYEEDNWEWVKVGNVIFRNVKECTRCVMTTIDPFSGKRNTNMEPLKTMKTYRLSNGPEKLPVMGLNLEIKRPGYVNVGDPVYVVRREN